MKTSAARDLLGDFQIMPQGNGTGSHKEVKPVTIWLPAEAKASYDRLQDKSGRRFSKKAREVLIELITQAEERLDHI